MEYFENEPKFYGFNNSSSKKLNLVMGAGHNTTPTSRSNITKILLMISILSCLQKNEMDGILENEAVLASLNLIK